MEEEEALEVWNFGGNVKSKVHISEGQKIKASIADVLFGLLEQNELGLAF